MILLKYLRYRSESNFARSSK